MKKRTWALLCLSMLLTVFGLISALVIAVDPFQIYRLSERFLPPIDRTTQVYANAGIARQYDYDSAIVGSSVTENFRPSYMDEQLGGRFIKLCTSGGSAYNHAITMDLAFRTHNIRRIVYGLDVYSFIGPEDETSSPVPFYLYDQNPFNDVSYWLNRSVLGSFLPRCLRTWGQHQDDSIRDSMYCWANQDEYGPVALYDAEFAPPQNVLPEDELLPAARINLNKHLLPFIEAHPDTQFDIFFPPYSAAKWSTMKSTGTLDAMIAVRNLLYDALSTYENVTLHDFSARADWVLNLDNYKDTLHYGQWINDAITRAIASGENVLTSRGMLDQNTAQLRRWADELIAAGRWIY